MKLGPFPTGAPWGSSAIQAWLDRLRHVSNAALDGHIGVGGTDQHPVFTTTVAGFVPAPGSATGEFLRDDGTWQASGGVTDHGALTGLADDDHTQYHNDARGDLRYQPLDSDLTAIAALTTTSYGRDLLELADADALGALVRLDQIAAPSASVDFADQQATSFRIENRTSDPGSPTTGQIWLRTDL